MNAPRPVTVHIADKDVRSLLAHAGKDHPVECCGVLVGRTIGGAIDVQGMMRGRNIAKGDRCRSYQLDWRTLLGARRLNRRSGLQIVGFFHSHPNGDHRPSDSDLALAWSDHVYMILRAPYEGFGAVSAWRKTRACNEGAVYRQPVAVAVELCRRPVETGAVNPHALQGDNPRNVEDQAGGSLNPAAVVR